MEMNPVQIINQPHPLIPSADRSFSAQDWRAGETARAALLRAGLDPHAEIVILVNDRTLTVAEWDTVCPQPDDLVHAVAAVSGGGDDGGSNPLQAVLTIAVMAFAWYAAPMVMGLEGGAAGYAAAAAAGSTFGVGIASAAISIAGNAVLGAVFKSSSGSLSAVNGSAAASASTPTYSLSGGSNSIRQYAPMQVVMGQHRVFPDYGSKPYTELHGDDQYLYQIFNFGLSSLQLTDLKIGDSPVSNYADISLCWSDANGNLPGFPGNVDTTEGASLVRGENWIVRTSAADTTRIAVDIEGTCYYTGDTGLLPCTVRVEAQYRPVGGSWAPMMYGTDVTYTTGYWSLQTTEVNTSNEQFSRYTIQHAYARTGHYEGETQFIGSVPASDYDGAWGYKDIYGTWHWESFNSGFANDGPQPIYTTVDHANIAHGASQSAQRHTFSIGVAAGVYDVRVRLTSAASSLGEIAVGDSRGGYTYSFSALRSYQEDTASYTGQTRLGMIIRASGQLSGTISKLSAMASAYTTALINGEWRWVPTSNPAWWYLDFARGRKNSSGTKLYGCHLTDGQIDIAGIIAWAAFCDAEALSCNLVLDAQQSASDTLDDIARCGLASKSWASGKLGVVWDKRNASPVAAFGMSNIIKGSFSVRYVTENLADEIVVSYVDKDQEWEQKQVRVNVPGVANPQRPSTLELKGCTNAQLAWKYANIKAAEQVYRRRRITWDADMEGFVCQRGDVALLQHDLTQWGYSGRLVSVDGAVITLDRHVPRSGAVEYMMLVRPDGSMQTWQVAPGSGNADTLTLPEAPELQEDALTLDHRWFFSPLSTPGKKVKLVSVKPISQYRVQIVATDENPEFYAAWAGVWTPPAQNTLLPRPSIDVANLRISERLVLSGGVVISRVEVLWDVIGDYDHAIFRYRLVDQQGWSRPVDVLGTRTEIDVQTAATLEIEVTAVGSMQLKRISNRYPVYCRSLPPANVTALALSVRNGIGLMTFAPSVDLDVQYGGRLWLRHTTAMTGAAWENSVDVAVSVPGNASSLSLLPQSGTYLAKWVDSEGNTSADATLLTTNYAAIESLNVIEQVAGSPDWPGSKTNTAYDNTLSGIVLDSSFWFDSIADNIDTWKSFSYFNGVTAFGFYALGKIDVGQVYDCILSVPEFVVETFDCLTDFDARTESIDTWPLFSGAGSDDGNAGIYVRYTTDDPNGGAPAWSEYHLLSAGSTIRARGFQFELRMFSARSNVNIAVQACTVSVDAPDRIESGEDLISGDAALAVAYAKPFLDTANLGITAQNMATGDFYTVTSKTLAGFSITFRNASGYPVSRTFDYLARGY